MTSVLIFSFFELSSSGQAESSFNIQNTTSNQCSNPTDFVTVNIKGGLFNADRITVPADSCVRITLQNSDNVDHTFTINKVGGSLDPSKNDANLTLQEINFFNIYAKAGSENSSNLMTPKVSSDFEFYCEITGHQAKGEWGFLFVSVPFRVIIEPFRVKIVIILTLVILAGIIFISLTIYSKRKDIGIRSHLENSNNKLKGDYKIQCPHCYSKLDPQETTCQNCGVKI